MNLKHPRAIQGIELLSRMRADPEADVREEAQKGLDLLAGRHPLATKLAQETVEPAEALPADIPAPTGTPDF